MRQMSAAPRPARTHVWAMLAAVVVALAWLALAPPARGANDFTFAVGSEPEIAVDDAGTAHAVWFDRSGPGAVVYCQIPRGSKACASTSTLAGDFGGRPHVLLPAPGQVVLLTGEIACDVAEFCTLARRSFDGGASFGPLLAIADPDGAGSLTGPDSSGNAVYGPGDSVTFVNDGATSGVHLTNAALSGVTEHDFATVFSSLASEATVGLSGASPVVAFVAGGSLQWTAYDGTGDLNAAGNYSPPQPVEPGGGGEDATLAGGPGGLFILYRRGGANARQYVARAFTGAGWGAAHPVSEVGDPIFAGFSQSSSGALNAVWVDNDVSPNRLLWSKSSDGASWSTPLKIANGDNVFPPVSVSAAADGGGFAAWDSKQGGPSGAAHELRATPLLPAAGGKGDPCQPPACVPAGGKPTKGVGDAKLELEVSVSSCASKKITARVKVRKRKGKTARVKVRKVVFQLDRSKRKTDRRKPYVKKFSLKKAANGSKHKLKTKLFLKVKKKGKTYKRKVKLTKRFTLCP